MRTFVSIFLIFQAYCCAWSQTDQTFDYGRMVSQLEKEIHSGKKRALRDLGTLLDRKEINHKIRAVFSGSTFFTPNEIDVEHCSKLEFLSFYYDNEQKIQYSELLHIFYITPLEKRKISFEMKSVSIKDADNNTGLIRHHFMEIDDFLSSKKYAEANNLVLKIASIKAINKERLLIKLLRDERLQNVRVPLRDDYYKNILNQLNEYPGIEIVEIVLQLLEKELLDKSFASSFLMNSTNCTTPFQSNPENTIRYYRNLIDSLETLEEIRRYGYDQIFKFKINFFQYPVDYYGKILSLTADYPRIRQNALLDLKRSKNPRALFYIAADFYRNRKNNHPVFDIDHVRLIKSRTNVEIGIKNRKEKITFHPDKNDKTAMLNYLIYWAATYQDYEWDESRKLFTSKMESFAKTQNYERLFRRFNSKNDSIAILSFLQLTEGDPIEITTLAKKYRQLLRNHNNSLPSIKYKYLEQLAFLTAFCRKNKVKYKPNKKLLLQLEKLTYPNSERERYSIENHLIKSLSVNDITTLEYWACVHAKNEKLSLSIGRILDWFYSENWKNIIRNNAHLRLYLKKSYLFRNIGVEGICNNYLNKFDLSNKEQLARLRELGNLESDKDILKQILLLLAEEPKEEFIAFSFENFLEEPLLFNQRDLKILPPPTLSELERIIELIQKSDDNEKIKKLFSFLRLQSDLEFVPKFFKLIDDERIIGEREAVKISVADNVVPMVENIYSFKAPVENPDQPFATNYWRSLWKKDSTNYRVWGKQFFQIKLDQLQSKPKLTINDLNQLTASSFYTEDAKPVILSALKKVKPIKNIRRLNIQPKLSVTADLKYLEDFVFSYKVLDDIPKLFEINNKNAEKILDFLIDKSSSFNYSEKGSFYNNLFRSPWLNNFINSGNLAAVKIETIKNAFENYLDESSFLSEYEEQTTVLNISKLENIGKSLEAKLSNVFQMDIDRESKVKILEEIIATVSYDEISSIIAQFDELSNILGDESCAFFHRDFGLPIFQINNQKEQNELLQNHRNLSEFDFYKYYLKKFGVAFLNKNDQLDFEKIYNILQFDIISPFTSEGGGKRDEYLFGVIRLLEINFETRLGFHKKLNEYQTFYSFSSSKRANAWISYFQQNNLIKKGQTASSFNKIRKEIKTISNNSTNKKGS